MTDIPLIVIVGPTASGKTTLAVELSETLGGEVVSADSAQVRQGMRIGTAAEIHMVSRQMTLNKGMKRIRDLRPRGCIYERRMYGSTDHRIIARDVS